MTVKYVLIGTLFVIASLLPTHALAGDNTLSFLSSIKVAPIADAPEGRFEIRLFYKDGRRLTSYLAKERSYTVVPKKEYLSVTSRGYSFPRKIAGNTAPSFVDNYDHKIFGKLKQEIIGNYGKKPGAASLIEYVNKYIEKKDYRRGFDVASRVAETREGDCTEHATLLVALMRMFNIPAKMVMGIKIFKDSDRYLAFGHAWVEYIDQGKWKAADPTLAEDVDDTYMPVGTLEDEGLDFSMDFISVIQKMPYRIEISGM
jgi:transglutaminase-like putative cysteine protease